VSKCAAAAAVLLVFTGAFADLHAQTSKPRTTASAAQAGQKAGSAPSKPASPININTASAAELEALPGVGARTAARIVDYRQKKGPFKKIEEILEISRSCR
jgi:competence protein ComEA